MLLSKLRFSILSSALAAPGLMEIGTAFLVVGFYLFGLPEFWNYKELLLPVPLALAFWVATVRHRLDPVFGRIYLAPATFWTLLLIAGVLVPDWRHHTTTPLLAFVFPSCFWLAT